MGTIHMLQQELILTLWAALDLETLLSGKLGALVIPKNYAQLQLS
jgi:hypothetical protein